MQFLNTGFFVTIDSNNCQLSIKAFKAIENSLIDKINEGQIKGLDYELYKNTLGREHFLSKNEGFSDFIDIKEEDLSLSIEHECGQITLITEKEYDKNMKSKIIKNVIIPIVQQFIHEYDGEKLFFIDVGYKDTYKEIKKEHISIY